MCDPLTLTAVGIAGTGIGALIGAGSAASGRSQARSAATTNSFLADQAAADAVARVTTAQLHEFSRATATTAAQKVSLAAGGGDINAGSAESLQLDTGVLTALDEEHIRNSAAREAYGYRMKGQQDLQAARYAEDAYTYQEAGGLISGIGKIAGLAAPQILDGRKTSVVADGSDPADVGRD